MSNLTQRAVNHETVDKLARATHYGDVLRVTLKRAPQAVLRGNSKGRAAKRALGKAAKTATRDMRSEGAKIVRDEKRVRARIIRKAIKERKFDATAFPMDIGVDINAKPVSLLAYPTRQVRKGVTTAVNRGQGRTMIASAFIATMSSGHKGVFLRDTSARLPITEQLGSRPQDVLRKTGRAEKVQRRGVRVLGERFPPLFDIELEKEEAKR